MNVLGLFAVFLMGDAYIERITKMRVNYSHAPQYDERRRPRRGAPAAVQSVYDREKFFGSNNFITIIHELKNI